MTAAGRRRQGNAEKRLKLTGWLDGSNMHCNVGLAILVKVAPISDCFDAGTHSVLDRRHAGLPDAAQQRFTQVGVLHGRRGIIVQTATDAFRMGPTADHVGRAKPHEFGARIGHFRTATERGLRRL